MLSRQCAWPVTVYLLLCWTTCQLMHLECPDCPQWWHILTQLATFFCVLFCFFVLQNKLVRQSGFTKCFLRNRLSWLNKLQFVFMYRIGQHISARLQLCFENDFIRCFPSVTPRLCWEWSFTLAPKKNPSAFVLTNCFPVHSSYIIEWVWVAPIPPFICRC